MDAFPSLFSLAGVKKEQESRLLSQAIVYLSCTDEAFAMDFLAN